MSGLERTDDVDFLEREVELERLVALARRAAAGSGAVALVRGPAGAGKTRLLLETRRRAAAEGMLVLSGRGGHLERSFAFGVVRQLFEPELATAGRARRERLLAGAARLAAPVAGLAPTAPAPAAAELDYALHHGLFWLTANLATERPVVLCVDDAHWADAPTLRWIAYVSRRLEGLPVLLALGVRSGEPGPASELIDTLGDESAPEVLEPPPLSEHAVAVLVARRLGADPEAAFVAACHRATAGNPFLLTELVTSLAAEGVAPRAGAVQRVEHSGPRTIASGVLRRIARLGPQAEALAHSVALLGTAVELRQAALLADLDSDTAAHTADRLADAAVLAQGRPLDFAHPIVRRAVHESLPLAVRGRGHARAATMLAEEDAPAGEVAAHLLHCDPAGDAWAVGVLREAANDALARGAADIAVTFLRRAAREPPDAQARPAVLRELGHAELRTGDRGDAMATAIEHLREAHAAATGAGPRAAVALDLAGALWGAERTEEAVDTLATEVARLGAGERDLALRLEGHLVATGWLATPTSRRVIGRLERFGPVEGRTHAERLALGAAAFEALAINAPVAVVADLAERAARDRGGPPDEMPPPPWPIVALTCADRLGAATEACDAAIAEARARGAVRGVIILSGWRTAIGLRRGRLAEAEADARHAFELAASRGFALDLPATRGFLVEVLVELGRLDEAERVVAEAGRPEDVPPHIAWNHFRHARARFRLAAGEPERALADHRACGAWLAEWGGTSPALLPWRSGAALAQLAVGDDEAALALAEEELVLARAAGAPRAVARALRAAGLARRQQAGIRLLSEAADSLEAAPVADRPELELAHALVELGAALRRSGERRAARERLAAGMDVAHRCGARPLVERAREELLAAGARPRRAALTGRDSLTASELRVARRAAAGRTNREIAQELFITPRTVEIHLTHVFRKLDVRSRAQLPAALGADEPDAPGS